MSPSQSLLYWLPASLLPCGIGLTSSVIPRFSIELLFVALKCWQDVVASRIPSCVSEQGRMWERIHVSAFPKRNLKAFMLLFFLILPPKRFGLSGA
ncbi:hypothetical protein Nepgr_027911 [Nepenthes gracilis]|uniref:Secreted protein n=1 Tax=Nepenthes gracilis TaxID=150966 RepID=A0AAD3Y1W3_NEPGR|nr:hypothetical protein Nepgr_027911 [Nepenthes gracilis]